MTLCRRCGKEYENPVPKVVNPTGNKEFATSEWCATCNKRAMTVVFRESSAYWKKGDII